MVDWKLLVLGMVMALVAAAIVIDRWQRRRHTPLAPRFSAGPTPQPLGMEATDLTGVQGILDRNAALARKTGRNGGATSWTEAGSIPPTLIPDDETYAARYQGAHQERK